MPPETFSWDRRDFRKHDRSASNARAGAGGLGRGVPQKWRNQQHQGPPPYRHQHQQQQRWYSEFRSPRLLPPGQSKKDGWPMYSEDAGQGFMRYDRNLEDENCQSFASRGDERYIRNRRVNRGSFTQKSWKNPSREATVEPHSLGETVTEVNNPRSIENTPPVSVSLSNQSQTQSLVKDKNDDNVQKMAVKGQESEKEKCVEQVERKPLKWSRNLSSWSSCISHSTSSKSLGHESVEVLAEVQTKTAALERSLSVDVSFVGSKNAPCQSEGTGSRKKPRLGWGEGLAKFEKKGVDGPEDGTTKSGLTRSGFSTESSISQSINLLEKSPSVETLMECASPSTPSSGACRFSSGVPEKSFKEANLDCDATNVGSSPRIASRAHCGGSTINLQSLELEPITNLSTLINELLQPNDPCSAENGDTQRMPMNKLLLWKVDVLKALEKTESEIESLEMELKSSASFPSEKAESSEGSRLVDVAKYGDLDKRCSQHVDKHVLTQNTSSEDNTWCSILSSNRDAASRALEQLTNLLPKRCISYGSVESIVSSLPRNSSKLKDRFLKKKQFLRFKEKVLTLKFKLFHHFWKEGRVVSIRTLRKTWKKFDPSRNGSRRNRSRVSFYAGGCQAVSADEVINFINGLLSHSAFKPCRNSLKMPALILDKQVKMSRFISNNGLVEDPRTVEEERYMMNPWGPQETEIFIEKLASFGKDFTKIASFLDHKTVADCIEFYYKNHKSDWFEEARKNSGFIKQRKLQTTTYLVSSGKRRNLESNAASLDILGAASEIAMNIDNAMDIQRKIPPRSSFDDHHHLIESDSLDMENHAREAEAADVLANICGSLSSEATTSSITTSLDLVDGCQDSNFPRISSSIQRASTPEVTEEEVDGECSDGSCSELNPTDWSDEEKSIFIQAVSSYGKDFVMVSQSVRTKSMNQCKVFFSKARKCLGLELVQSETGPLSGDADEGVSDIEDESHVVKIEPDFETSGGESGAGPLDTTVNEAVLENSSIPGDCKDDEPVKDIDSHTKGQNVMGVSSVSVRDVDEGVSDIEDESHVVKIETDYETSKGESGVGPLDSMNNEAVLENSSIPGDDEPVKDIDSHTKGQNVMGVSSVSAGDPQTVAVTSYTESDVRIKVEDDHSLIEVSNDCCSEENQCRRPLPSGDANAFEVNDTNSGMIVKPLLTGNVSHASDDKKSQVQKRTEVGTSSAEKSCVSSLPQNGRVAPVTSSTIFSVPTEFENTPDHKPLLPVEACGADGRLPQNLPCYSLSNSTESSSQILLGYPVSLQAMKGKNGNDKKLNSDWNTDFSLQKCKETRQSDVSSSTSGGVKLFGKILSPSAPSSQHKPNKPVEDDHKPRHESLNLKLSCHQKGGSDFSQPNSDFKNYVPTEGRFEFWDGNRMRRGNPPVPDSAILLASFSLYQFLSTFLCFSKQRIQQ